MAKKKRKAKRKAAPRRRNSRARVRSVPRSTKKSTTSRKLRRAAKSGNAAKLAYHKRRSYDRMVKALAKTNPTPRKAKFGRWYKGPKGTRVRVRRVRGKIVVDVKK